ncbi:MAG: ATP-binding protein [Candidatus Omnitrophica bacterium]|nr:ATP-binding protein [Candidatus Omnitrophota bacterium]
MKRDAYQNLVTWKNSERRKPLLLKGARQTGKTYLLIEFGKKEYEKVHYFNFEEVAQLSQFFEKNLDPRRILSDLAIYSKNQIRPGKDLIVFDEIQTSNAALNSLKYFHEQAPEYHLAAAGSLLGVKLSSPGSFPVGKVNFLDLHPLTFLEFLDAVGESRYRKVLEETEGFHPYAGPFHRDLIDLLHQYYFVGGMPEAVQYYAEKRDPGEIRQIQREVIDSYVLDFAKHAPPSDIAKLTLIWNSLPQHLARENRKFIFSAIKKGARAREYENALAWLDDTGLIYRASAVEKSQLPLKHYANQSCFKVYALDVGLLGAMAQTPTTAIVERYRLFEEYKGALAENYVAQQLVALLETKNLYYWRSEGGRAEIDFLIELKDHIYPLEVKSGVNPRSRSLASYASQFAPHLLIRSSLLNLKRDQKILNLPLYALSLLKTLTLPA